MILDLHNHSIKSDDGKARVGTPLVSGARVKGKVLGHERGKKIVIFKMKRRKNYRRKRGHRQPYTQVKITAIQAKG